MAQPCSSVCGCVSAILHRLHARVQAHFRQGIHPAGLTRGPRGRQGGLRRNIRVDMFNLGVMVRYESGCCGRMSGPPTYPWAVTSVCYTNSKVETLKPPVSALISKTIRQKPTPKSNHPSPLPTINRPREPLYRPPPQVLAHLHAHGYPCDRPA